MGDIDVNLHLNDKDVLDTAEISIAEVPSDPPDFYSLRFKPDNSYGGISIFLAIKQGEGKTLTDIKDVIESFEGKMAMRKALLHNG